MFLEQLRVNLVGQDKSPRCLLKVKERISKKKQRISWQLLQNNNSERKKNHTIGLGLGLVRVREMRSFSNLGVWTARILSLLSLYCTQCHNILLHIHSCYGLKVHFWVDYVFKLPKVTNSLCALL